MKLVDRTVIFANYPLIGALIRDFQTLGFDPETDDPGAEWCDAMQLPEVPIAFANHILTVPHGDIETYPKRLAAALVALLAQLEVDRLLLLSSIKSDLFGDRRYGDDELIRVRQQLEAVIGKTSFRESIALDVGELEPLVDVFFWLSRLDPSIPEYIFWVDSAQRCCFFICRYGNIHFLSLCGDGLIGADRLEELGFVVGEDHDQFA